MDEENQIRRLEKSLDKYRDAMERSEVSRSNMIEAAEEVLAAARKVENAKYYEEALAPCEDNRRTEEEIWPYYTGYISNECPRYNGYGSGALMDRVELKFRFRILFRILSAFAILWPFMYVSVIGKTGRRWTDWRLMNSLRDRALHAMVYEEGIRIENATRLRESREKYNKEGAS